MAKSQKRRTLKLMADYGAWPLWDSEAPEYNVDPKTLPLSEETKRRLVAWAQVYDATLNQEYPPDSAFPSQEAERAFRREGSLLMQQLRSELGSDYEVVGVKRQLDPDTPEEA